ncbi:GNAT family N-acetyltransferase [Nocardioides solisilvae]|uniref:GNAT family N-acetyltransferase n=1 Tax=Nocardioides solisilvae TaxID=1542435 RepID=UPI0013A56DEA|nr:GNAT family N-acetyltransferase [Nocardioides solisilvae]
MSDAVQPEFLLVRADDPRVEALLADYAAELAGEGIVLHQGEGGSVTADEMVPPTGAFHLVTLAGAPVACGGVRLLGPRVAEVKRMYVAPAGRRRGVARALLARLEEDAWSLGADVVRLDTGPTMAPAVALYRSAGYEPVEDYNGNPHAGHWFGKTLGPGGSWGT